MGVHQWTSPLEPSDKRLAEAAGSRVGGNRDACKQRGVSRVDRGLEVCRCFSINLHRM